MESGKTVESTPLGNPRVWSQYLAWVFVGAILSNALRAALKSAHLPSSIAVGCGWAVFMMVNVTAATRITGAPITRKLVVVAVQYGLLWGLVMFAVDRMMNGS